MNTLEKLREVEPSLSDRDYFDRIIEVSVDHFLLETVNADPNKAGDWQNCMQDIEGGGGHPPQTDPFFTFLECADARQQNKIIRGSGIPRFLDWICELARGRTVTSDDWENALFASAKDEFLCGFVSGLFNRGVSPIHFDEFIEWRRISGTTGEEARRVFDRLVIQRDRSALEAVCA